MAEKRAVQTEAAPAPFRGAPYSQAIVAGGFVFVSGQVGMRPGETQVVSETVEEQTEQTFANLRAVLEAADSSLDRIVKTTVYLATLDDVAAMNEVYRRHTGSVRRRVRRSPPDFRRVASSRSRLSRSPASGHQTAAGVAATRARAAAAASAADTTPASMCVHSPT